MLFLESSTLYIVRLCHHSFSCHSSTSTCTLLGKYSSIASSLFLKHACHACDYSQLCTTEWAVKNKWPPGTNFDELNKAQVPCAHAHVELHILKVTWNLEIGIRNLEFGTQNLEPSIWNVDFGVWSLEFLIKIFDKKNWINKFGF